MILDRLENHAFYRSLGSEIVAAFDFLRTTDFSKMADGRYEIDGDRVFAVISHYRPKPLAEAKWEAHRQYLDVQYLAHGSERIGYAARRNGATELAPYDAQKDLVFYDVQGNFFDVPQGAFAIFAPQDIHAPCLAGEKPVPPSEVCKVVVKCRISD